MITEYLTSHNFNNIQSLFVQKGNPLGPINLWILFRKNYGTKRAPYVYTPKTTLYQQKERSKHVSFQNGGQKFEKPFSQGNFSKLKNMNTLQFWNKYEKKNIIFENGDQNNVSQLIEFCAYAMVYRYLELQLLENLESFSIRVTEFIWACSFVE